MLERLRLPKDGPARAGKRRGVSMVMSLTMITVMSVAVTAVLPQANVRTQESETEVLKAISLQVAEAGLNYESHWIEHLMDPHVIDPSDPTSGLIMEYPTGSGFYFRVGVLSRGTGGGYQIISQGRGAAPLRELQTEMKPKPYGDLFGIFGVNSVDVGGSVAITGAVGGNGTITVDGSATVTKGPVVKCGASASFPNGEPTVQSAVTSPAVKSWPLPVRMPTASAIADFFSGSTTGMTYFKTNNSNRAATTGGSKGLYQLWRKSNGQLVEEPVLISTDHVLDSELLRPKGRNGWTYLGTKFYPGHYYFTKIDMNGGTNAAGQVLIHNVPSATNTDPYVVFWIDETSGITSDLTPAVNLSDTSYPGRFRIYSRSKGGVRISGPQKLTPMYGNIFCYDQDANGSGYGTVEVKSGMAFQGSIIAHNVWMRGGADVTHVKNTGEDPNGKAIPPFMLRMQDWNEK
ncbi:MAG: hypothetical protein ACK47B_24615 [Armatimonadota bacterium]